MRRGVFMNSDMIKKAEQKSNGNLKAWMPVINGVLIATVFTVVAILLYAIILKIGLLNESTIPMVNQIIKIVGIAVASYYATRKENCKLLLKGAAAGVLYIIAGLLLFSLLQGSFSITQVFLADLVMGAVIGGIVALLRAQLGGTKQKGFSKGFKKRKS